MSYFKIDENNEIYYEYEPPKGNGYTFVFVNGKPNHMKGKHDD